SNGTYVSGKRVVNETKLASGDRVQLGAAVVAFRVVTPASSEKTAMIDQDLVPVAAAPVHEIAPPVPAPPPEPEPAAPPMRQAAPAPAPVAMSSPDVGPPPQPAHVPEALPYEVESAPEPIAPTDLLAPGRPSPLEISAPDLLRGVDRAALDSSPSPHSLA